ncbi:MAG: hypothetical protein WCP58_07485 [bacterium]
MPGEDDSRARGGEAAHCGFQHGYLLAQELKEILRSVKFLV